MFLESDFPNKLAVQFTTESVGETTARPRIDWFTSCNNSTNYRTVSLLICIKTQSYLYFPP